MDRNPFTARRIAPGAIPFRFESEGDAARLVAAVRHHAAAAIEGPHGTGKTTLVRALLPELAAGGTSVAVVTLGDGATRGSFPPLPRGLGLPRALVAPGAARPDLLVVDGFEQWGWWRRARVVAGCRRAGVRLLVTAHRDVGLPVIHRTAVSAATVTAVHAALVRDRPTAVAEADLVAAFHRHAGNLREALFECYDLHERRRSTADSWQAGSPAAPEARAAAEVGGPVRVGGPSNRSIRSGDSRGR